MDIYILLTRLGLTNATSANLTAAQVITAALANPGRSFIIHLSQKSYLVVPEASLGTYKGPVAAILGPSDRLQVTQVKTSLSYPLGDIQDTLSASSMLSVPIPLT